jgi:hypothetical protein
MENVKPKIKKKTTVREELENLNVIYVMKRLNNWYCRHLSTWRRKQLQGMEASDFSINVISKIISGERSWDNFRGNDFMSFVFDVAKSEFSTWKEGNAHKSFITFDLNQENKSNLHIRDNYNGF